MALKKLLASMGAGGASVETVLKDSSVVPGGVVAGEVRIQGGSMDQQIEGLSVGTAGKGGGGARATRSTRRTSEFTKTPLGGASELKSGAVYAVPFSLEILRETPITVIHGQSLRGMNIGVCTELEIARAKDSGDLDPITVHPLPAQKAILDAFLRLGFRFKHADMERGHIRGTRQRLPFYQEIEFFSPPRYKGISAVELSFLADGNALDVVLVMDKKPGIFSEGSDTF